MFQDEYEPQDSQQSLELNPEKPLIRISTAPARPLTPIEEFKRSKEFFFLEQTVFSSNNLLQKNYLQIDLDSSDGQKSCKKFLSCLERLCETVLAKKAFRIIPANRDYREQFSKAYKILYNEGNLCYLIEILDSAQEDAVLENGRLLLRSFQRMQNVLRNCYTKITQESIGLTLETIKQEIVMVLEENDSDWAHFEQIYVNELMIIEKKARRLISDAIMLDKELQSIEIREKMRGKILLSNLDAYNSSRRKLSALISQINSVANIEGTGRDDLDLSILLEAEGVIRRVSREQSKAVRLLAEQIRNSFMNTRLLLRKYDENIEMVDPQLKNNADLLGVLQEYEKSWEKGKHYLLEAKKCGFLLSFSHMLESTGEKYREFQEKLECRDADIFVIIPCLLILKFLDNEDRSVCLYFFPQMAKTGEKSQQIHSELVEEFKKWKALNLKNYQYFNIIEKALIGLPLAEGEKENVEKAPRKCFEGILKKIKVLAIELERNKPTEWNEFLDAALMN